MTYVKTNRTFDVRTLEILILGTDKDVDDLIKRNVARFKNAIVLSYAEQPDELDVLTREYERELKNKIDAAMKRLATTSDNGQKISCADTATIFKDTISAVYSALIELEPHIFFSERLSTLLEDEFTYQKEESISHFSMFFGQYKGDLEMGSTNHMNKYINIMIRNGYVFEKDGLRYSLLIFLSFYEAYVKRIVGITLLSFAKENKRYLKKLLNSESDNNKEELELVLDFVQHTKIPLVKSCYFTDFQKWFKGDISEFIKRFLMRPVDESHSIPYQKKTLVDKKMLNSEECLSVIEPPIIISSPAIIDSFFLLRDSHYIIM